MIGGLRAGQRGGVDILDRPKLEHPARLVKDVIDPRALVRDAVQATASDTGGDAVDPGIAKLRGDLFVFRGSGRRVEVSDQDLRAAVS